MENEKTILGAICLDPDEAMEHINLSPEDFTGAHREIFRVMLDLHLRDVKPDLVSLTNELKRIGKLSEAGDTDYLLELVDYAPTAANIRYFVGKVRERSQRRKLRGLAEAIKINGESMEVSALIENIETVIDEIRGKSTTGPQKATVALRKAMKNIEARTSNKGKIPGVPTGLTSLDGILGGIQPGKLYIIAGRPGMGKSALAMGIGRHVSKDLPVVLFSMEMPDDEIGERLLSSEARVDNGRMRFGLLRDADWPKLTHAAGVLHHGNLWIDDTPILTVSEIRARAKQIKRKHGGMGAVIIDYLQLINGEGKRYDVVTDASRMLKLLAKELNAPVIALSQLNRSLENRPDKRPIMADLRETGALEQDADVIMFCYREAVYCDCKGMTECEKNHQRKAQIIVGKQRGGPLGVVDCLYIGEHTAFVEL